MHTKAFKLSEGSTAQHQRERSSSFETSKQTTPTAPHTTPSQSATQSSNKTNASKKTSEPLASINEAADASSGPQFTPLDSSATMRVVFMSPKEALEAEIHLQPSGACQDKLDGPIDPGDHILPARDRAFSAPKRLMDVFELEKKLKALDLVSSDGTDHFHTRKIAVKDLEKDLKAFGNAATVELDQSRTTNVGTPKPTAQEWVADIDCISNVFGAWLADDRDR